MITNYLKKHWGALGLAVVVGLIMVGRQIVFISSLWEQYQGLYLTGTDSEAHYLARMQEFYDGNGLGNALLYDYKNDFPSTFFTISESILAFPGKLLHLPVPALNLFYKFFLPFIITLLVYALVFRLTGSILWSLSATAVTLLGNDLFSLPKALYILRHQLAFNQFAIYSRPINPEFSSVFFFSYLHIFLTGIRRGDWRWFVILGLLFGLSFYTYLFSFTFLLALNFIFVGLYFLIKRRDLAVKLLLTLLLGIIVGIPSILNALAVSQHPLYKNIKLFVGIHNSHLPIISTAGLIALVIFLYHFVRCQSARRNYFILGLTLTAVAVVNQQVLTGIWLHEGHYHWYFNIPIFTIALFYVGYDLFKDKGHKLIYPVLLLVGLLSLYSALFVQYSSYRFWREEFAQKQNYSAVFNWLKQNTVAESVVLANDEISELIPVYTANNVYMEIHAIYYLLPTERVSEALFMYLKLAKINPDKIGNLAEIKQQPLLAKDLISIYPANLVNEYRIFWKESFERNLKHYRLDYMVWDKLRNPEWSLDKYTNLQLAYQYENLGVYRVVK